MRLNRIILGAGVIAFAGLLSGCGLFPSGPPTASKTSATAPPPPAQAPSDWMTITTTNPNVSIQVPNGWKKEDVANQTVGAGASQTKDLIRASAPPTQPGQQYVSTVLVNVGDSTIQLPMTDAILADFKKGILDATPDAKIISLTLVTLPCGQAIEVEQTRDLAAGTAKVPYHQFLYTVPMGNRAFDIVISAPEGDDGVAKLQDDVIKTFKVS